MDFVVVIAHLQRLQANYNTRLIEEKLRPTAFPKRLRRWVITNLYPFTMSAGQALPYNFIHFY